MMPVAGSLVKAVGWMSSQGNLLIPLVLTLWIAWGDLRTRRIPNYLTLGTAVAGLAYNFMGHGLPGLADGILGMLLGFAFLILPYLWGGMGAGDVKALAALGAWLGPRLTVFLFCYMGIAGGVIALGYLVWQGSLWQKIKQGWTFLLNLILCRPDGAPRPPSPGPINRRNPLWSRHCRGDDCPGRGGRLAMVPVHRLRWTKLRKCDGAAMVEFAIGSTVLIMFVLGIIEFGFLWYQKQVITNASREAARYGVTYRTKADGTRLAPKNFTSPTIAEVVNNYCTGRIPAGSWTVSGVGRHRGHHW